MNATTQRTVTHLLDPDWVEAIREELENNSGNVAFAVEPELMGRFCAEMGMANEPLAHGYRTVTDCESFIIGYKDTTRLWAEMMQAENDRLYNGVDIDGQLQMLIDDMLDREDWARGGW